MKTWHGVVSLPVLNAGHLGPRAMTLAGDGEGEPTPSQKIAGALRWLPSYGLQRLTRSRRRREPGHLIIALADHFEPSILPERPMEYAHSSEQERRLDRWCREYPSVVRAWRDADGWPLRHTYFYPAEQYEKGQIDRLADHCQQGWGELEVHLHHGTGAPDSADNTRAALLEFVDRLVAHGALARWDGVGIPRYAFVHGNWALANSAGGRSCGVDSEMQVLADTGCYADLTLPSAPNRAQVAKINALYECRLPLDRRAPHRHGRNLRVGRAPRVYPLIVEGPLGLNFSRRLRRWPLPAIENGALTAAYPPTMERLALWRQAGIVVAGRPNWLFIKLHCHGMDPRDEPAMLGASLQVFLEALTERARGVAGDRLHFVTAREMVNIALAACDGRDGNPGEYRDYHLQLITPVRQP